MAKLIDVQSTVAALKVARRPLYTVRRHVNHDEGDVLRDAISRALSVLEGALKRYYQRRQRAG